MRDTLIKNICKISLRFITNPLFCFGDGTRFVVNRQPPVKQLWLATKDKGYHFDYNKKTKEWICNKTQRDFTDVFNESVSQMIKQTYKIEL